MSEEFKPRPYNDEKGRINDVRIAAETAQLEDKIRGIASYRPFGSEEEEAGMNHTADSWAESIYMREGLPVTLAEVPDEVQGKCIEYIRRTFGKATVPDDAKFNKVEKKEGGVSYISLQKLEDGQSVVLIAATTQHGLAVYEIDKKGGLDRDMFKS